MSLIHMHKKVLLHFLLPLFIGLLIYFIPLDIPNEAHVVLAISISIGILWFTEVIPIHITALLIPLLLALFTKTSVTNVFSPFFDPVVVLILGGFVLGRALTKYHLDEEIAYFFIHTIGKTPKRFLLGIMLATGFVSFWMSNSAAAAVMMPIAAVVLADTGLKHLKSNYAKATVLGVAYASTIGGFGTLVGTPPNVIAVKFLSDIKINVSFSDWSYYSLPFTIILLIVSWFVLLQIFKPEIRTLKIKRKPSKLNKQQKYVLIIFFLTVALWVTSEFTKISPSLIALIPIILYYLFELMNVEDFGKLHWDMIILIGGGLSLGSAIISSGLNNIIGDVMIMLIGGNPLLITLILVALFSIFISIMSPNTGAASFLVPIMISTATGLGLDPRVLALVAGMAVSIDFIIPVGTPPNAIAYATKYIHVKDMVKAGLILVLIAAFLLGFLAWLYW